MRFSRLITFFVALTFIPAAAFAQAAILGNVYGNHAKQHYAFVVEKKSKKLFIVSVDGNSAKVIRTINILTGKNNGDKKFEGDEKTPEGIYYTRPYISPGQLIARYGDYGKIYGDGAYPLNYPNIVDMILNKTGGGIWIHGIDPHIRKLATQGCVAMDNGDLASIAQYLKTSIPVIITEDALDTTAEGYETDRAQLLGMLNSYLDAWTNNDFDTFASFIHTKFRSTSGQNRSTFLSQKERLMKAYPQKKVDISDIRIYRENGNELLFRFEQFYCADNIITAGNKQVYFTKDGNDFKVIAEEFDQGDVRPYLNDTAREFAQAWAEAWRSKDVDKYISFYNEAFSSRGMNRDAWKEYKAGVFSRNQFVLEVSDVTVQSAGQNRLVIRMKQKYQSASINDTGWKELIVTGCPGEFTILAENWKPLR